LLRLPVGARAEVAPALAAALLPVVGSRGRWRMQLREARFVTEGLYQRTGATGDLERWFGKVPVRPGALRMVPRGGAGEWVATLEPEGLRRIVRELRAIASAPA